MTTKLTVQDVELAIAKVEACSMSDSAFKAIEDARWLVAEGNLPEAFARAKDAWRYDHPMQA